MSVTVLNVSHSKRELNNFHAYIENGFEEDVYLFVHFLAPAIVVLEDVEHKVEKDACIIYSPKTKQNYRHYDGVFLNGFLIFKTRDRGFVARYGLPENEIFNIEEGDEVNNIMELITYTMTDRLIDRSEETKEHVNRLFETLSACCIETRPNSKRRFETRKRFIELRDMVMRDPKNWNVDKMAKKVWLTRSRFSEKYMELFKTTPSADLIQLKVNYGKELLENSNLSVQEIANRCGYGVSGHFIRVFKTHTGCTPLEHRKKHKTQKI